MLLNESIWLKREILNLGLLPNSNILNFGSQNAQFLKRQSYIYENVIKTVIDRKFRLVNFDLREGPGVDLAGNIFDESIFHKLLALSFDAVLVCNVLEHVPDIQSLCERLEQLVNKDGYILFSGPYEYPRHQDPIDNMFRPKPDELSEYFRNCIIIKSEIVVDFNYWHYITLSSNHLFNLLTRLVTPFYKFDKWRKVVLPKLFWLNRNFKVSCAVLKKQ